MMFPGCVAGDIWFYAEQVVESGRCPFEKFRSIQTFLAIRARDLKGEQFSGDVVKEKKARIG